MRILPISYSIFTQKINSQQNNSTYIVNNNTKKQDEIHFAGNSEMNDEEFERKITSVSKQLYSRLQKENLEVSNFKDFPNYLEKDTVDFASKLIADKEFPIHLIISVIGEISGVNLLKPYVKENYKLYVKMYNQCINNPDQYTPLHHPPLTKEDIDNFFDKKAKDLLILSGLGDEELNDIILRKRFDKAPEYLKQVSRLFKFKKYELLKQGLKCKNTNAHPLKPNQKFELLELFNAYGVTHSSPQIIADMVDNGTIDLTKLKENLFNQIWQSCEYTKEDLTEIPKKKLYSWDMRYLYLLPKHLQTNRSDFIDIIKMGNSRKNFKTIILDKTNEYGKINEKTKNRFKNQNLNFAKWFTPPQEINRHLVINDHNAGILENTCLQFEENVNLLRKIRVGDKYPVKLLIDKRYKNFIQDNEFVIPEDIRNNRVKLRHLISGFKEDMKPVAERTIKNVNNNKDHATLERATLTMTILNHLDGLIVSAWEIPESFELHRNLDLTIKMWDRIPQKDLFQGNYSTCCIGIGEFNAQAITTYLRNTTFNMIEIVDNNTSNTIGNALCYYALDGNKKPILIIDNIEINNNFKATQEARKYIRDEIFEYCTTLNKIVANDENLPIYLGNSYNDVPTSDLEEVEDSLITLLGKLDTNMTYLDAFKGWTNSEIIRDNITLLKVK